MKEIERYVKERDEAVASMDLEKFKEFILKTSGKTMSLPDDKVLEITMRKMAVHSTNIDTDIRVEAFRWLLENGYDFCL